MTGPFMSSSGPRPIYPTLGANGLPTFVGFDHATGGERADLRAMPDWAGRSDFRTRRPVVAVRTIPACSAEHTGAGRWCPPPATGRTLTTAAVLLVAAAVWAIGRRM